MIDEFKKRKKKERGDRRTRSGMKLEDGKLVKEEEEKKEKYRKDTIIKNNDLRTSIAYVNRIY